MATYVHGKRAAVFNGALDLRPWTREATASISLDPADTSHHGSDSKTFIIGQNDATFSGEGLYDGSVGAIQDHMESLIANEAGAAPASIPLTFAPEGVPEIGAFAVLAFAKVTSYEVNPVISDVVTMTFEMIANGGMHGGHVLFLPAAISATTAGASVNNLAASTLGGQVNVHVLANSRSANVQITLQHSTNNSTWVDLVALPVVTTGTLTAYRAAELPLNVNQYLRINVTLTAGTGTVSIVAAASRN